MSFVVVCVCVCVCVGVCCSVAHIRLAKQLATNTVYVYTSSTSLPPSLPPSLPSSNPLVVSPGDTVILKCLNDSFSNVWRQVSPLILEP